MGDAVLALNAGSSSIKFGVYDIDEAGQPVTLARGSLETGKSPRLVAKSADGKPFVDRSVHSEGLHAGIDALLPGSSTRSASDGWSLAAIASCMAACPFPIRSFSPFRCSMRLKA